MKKILAILVVFGISLQEFSKILLYIDYELNKDFIAANLCVNKKQTKNLCYGSCYLKKKLDNSRGDEDKATNVLVYKYEVEGIKEVKACCANEAGNLLSTIMVPDNENSISNQPSGFDPPPPRV